MRLTLKKKRKIWERLGGREGVSKKIIELINLNNSLSYKGAIILAGKIKLLAEIAETADEYWKSKVTKGYYDMLEELELMTEDK